MADSMRGKDEGSEAKPSCEDAQWLAFSNDFSMPAPLPLRQAQLRKKFDDFVRETTNKYFPYDHRSSSCDHKDYRLVWRRSVNFDTLKIRS
jgi:hypothetical protein